MMGRSPSQELIVVSFAVLAFSIFLQGLTMPVLVKRLGISSGGR